MNTDYETVTMRAGSKEHVQYGATPTFNELSTIQLFHNQYASHSIREFTFGVPRIRVFDQFLEKLTERYQPVRYCIMLISNKMYALSRCGPVLARVIAEAPWAAS